MSACIAIAANSSHGRRWNRWIFRWIFRRLVAMDQPDLLVALGMAAILAMAPER